MICVGLMYRRQNLEPTRTVGARAASWGLTYLLATLLFLGLHFYLLFALDGTEAEDSFFPIGIPITIWPLISVLHFSLSIVGGVKAGRGRTMGFYGVPLARARPTDRNLAYAEPRHDPPDSPRVSLSTGAP